MRAVDAERLLAWKRLLAQPDDPPMRGKRRHRLTWQGKPTRLQAVWAPSVRVWTSQRLADAIGPLNGWKPAERSHQALPFLRAREHRC